jgi:hypothetical protein
MKNNDEKRYERVLNEHHFYISNHFVMNFDEKVLIIDENDFERSEHRLKKRK